MDFVLFQIRYTGYRDRTHDERIVRFQSECREGRCPVVSKLFIVTLLTHFQENILSSAYVSLDYAKNVLEKLFFRKFQFYFFSL